MAKSYLPLAVVTGTLVLAFGCGGDESVASKSARAFREAQQRGETSGGDGQAHGHGALSPAGAASADAHGAMGHDGGDAPPASGPEMAGEAKDHAAMGHGGGGSAPAGSAATNHAEMGHGSDAQGASPPQPSRGGDHSAKGHDSGAGTPQPSPPGQPVDHAAMGHGSPAGAQRPTMGGIQAGTVVGPAAPVSAGAPASTLSPDPFDAPAPTSVIEAQRSAATSGEMSGGEGHGGHGGPRTYRHVDAGRGPDDLDASRDDEAGAGATGHEGHGTEATAPTSGPGAPAAGAVEEEEATKVVYVCPMHPEVRSDEPGACRICGATLQRREK